jgi:hypothetical protein
VSLHIEAVTWPYPRLVNSLLELLREYAANPDDDPDVSPIRDWSLEANGVVTRLKAYARELSTDPETAWRAATELRDAIVGLGYELRGDSEVGAVSEEGPGLDLPIQGWRGFVNLLFATK